MTDQTLPKPSSEISLEELRQVWELDSKRLLYHVKRGKEGFNEGFSNGMKRLNQYIYGTHKARYYLIGADSGVGKTTLADFMFFYSLYVDCKKKGITLDLDYYSFEIPEFMKKARMASLLYYVKYKEELPAQYMMGQIAGQHITSEQEAKLLSVAAEVEEMFDSVNFIEAPQTPVQMWRRMVARAEKYGKVIRDTTKAGLPTEIIGYEPRNDKIMKVNIVDHLALLEIPGGHTLKQTMDLASIFFVRGRNLFGDTSVVVQQFNSEMQGAAREQRNPMAYVPTRLDFGDSKYTYRDADVVLGLIKPVDFQLTSFGPFSELEKWGDYLIANFLLKNRYGPTAPALSYFIDPIAGIPVELPEGKDWDLLLQQQYIERAVKLDQVCQLLYPR